MSDYEAVAKLLEPFLWKPNAHEKEILAKRPDNSYVPGQLALRIAKLPKSLQSTTNVVLGFHPDGTHERQWYDFPESERPAMIVRLAENRKIRYGFDAMPKADRLKIFAAISPTLAESIEQTWQSMKSSPINLRGFFCAKDHPSWTIQQRLSWLRVFSLEQAKFTTEVANEAWLAAWSKHAFSYTSWCSAPLLAATIDAGSRTGEDVLQTLMSIVRGEHEVGVVDRYVLSALLGCNRPEAWELIEKMLLAAQRQEGLRQSIFEAVPFAQRDAFVRLLAIIRSENLIRFSSVALCVNSWLQLHWDSSSTAVLNENVDSFHRLLTQPSAIEAATRGDDAEESYRGLMALSVDDVDLAIATAGKLLVHPKVETRFTAVYFLKQVSLPAALVTCIAALDDEDLRVAMAAGESLCRLIRMLNDFPISTKTKGNESQAKCLDLDLGSLDREVAHQQVSGLFERFERLYSRLTSKPQTLKPIVWPWTEAIVDRSTVTGWMLQSLDQRPPTRMLPYIDDLNNNDKATAVHYLAAQQKWDELTRQTLRELLGHAATDVREAAMKSFGKHPIQAEDLPQLESYLTRTATSLRKGVIGLLMSQSDTDAFGSVDRLLAMKALGQRAAGLEMLRLLANADRDRASCIQRAIAYRAQRGQSSKTELTKDELTQLEAIEQSNQESHASSNDGFGSKFFSPANMSPVVQPSKNKISLATKAAMACLQSLDALVDNHRLDTVQLDYYGRKTEKLLGELTWYLLPSWNTKDTLTKRRKRFPKYELFETWAANRPVECRDNDGLELPRAFVALRLMNDTRNNKSKSHQFPIDDVTFAAIAGSGSLPEMKYEPIVSVFTEWMMLAEATSTTIDFILDGCENALAHVDQVRMKRLEEPKPKERNPYSYSDANDWRGGPVFNQWWGILEGILPHVRDTLTPVQSQRVWSLYRFYDQPTSKASRKRQPIKTVLQAFHDGYAKLDDVADVLLNHDENNIKRYSALAEVTDPMVETDSSHLLNQLPKARDLVDRVRDFLLDQELRRGESATPGSMAALSIGCFPGCGQLFRILAALNNHQFKIDRSWRGLTSDSRSSTLTQMLRSCYPTADETADDFAVAADAAVASGECSQDRLLELAFLAPQWSQFVGRWIKWNGFSEALYWFLAHMNMYSGARQAAAGAEGLVTEGLNAEIDTSGDANASQTDSTIASDMPPADEDDSSSETDSQNGNTQEDENEEPLPRRKLTAWQRLMLERTPITEQGRLEGAVDVAWFRRTWETLGSERWHAMAAGARFAANSAQAKKAQFLADVLLGVTSREDLFNGIKKKNLKEHVRLLGLLPLASGAASKRDLMERYEVLQDYKKYARKLSSLTKPEALRAVDIGMDNLARLAGYSDPLRLEWALEAESLRDLAAGPVSLTQDDITLTLTLNDDARAELTIQKGGKSLKSVPAAFKKKHAQVAEMIDRVAELRKKSARVSSSLESAMCRGDEIEAGELVQLAEHPLLAKPISKLLFIGDGIAGYPDQGGRVLRDANGKNEPIKKSERLRIAHPVDLLARGDWDHWQRECFAAERIQPFKQIFRELYVPTAQELADQKASYRFEGNQVGPRQAMALWGAQGWNTEESVFKVFYDEKIIADVGFQWTAGTAASIEGWTLESVSFRPDEDYRPMKLADVPPRIFSEVMRDIDLVVSVAHRGQVDPEATASTTQMRAALARETCELLGLTNVQFQTTHAIIRGHYAEYSLHLGSGTVHRLPGGSIAIIPVHAQHRGRIFLPFADNDPKTAEILSKVLLLARDQEIQDPTILAQLGAPPIQIAPHEQVRKQKTIQTTRSDDVAAHDIEATDASQPIDDIATASITRRYELSEGSANKFWEIEISGKSITTRWGRIGSNGQSKTKAFETESAAKSELEKLIKEKTGKGYGEC